MSQQNLKIQYNKRKSLIKSRLKEFSKNNDYFYELCLCILTPQSNARRCYEAISKLKEVDFLKKDINPKGYIKKIRFYNNKTNYLLDLKKRYCSIEDKLKTRNPHELREYLVKEIKGIGYKESSHFLRNIGYKDLAILDRHILKCLKEYNIIKEIPKPLTKNKYLEIEEKFKEFSEKVKIPMDELDLLFWSMKTGVIFR